MRRFPTIGPLTRFAICDDDDLYATIIEAMLTERGHEVVGVSTSSASSVALIETARPEAVIFDSLLGYTSDFDVIATCNQLGMTAIVFSTNPEQEFFARYAPAPIVVHKPDLTELERAVDRIETDEHGQANPQDRRQRPGRTIAAPTPTSLSDAHAFYAAFEQAVVGDALVAFDLHHAIPLDDVRYTAEALRQVLRDGDRLLVSSSMLRVFIPAAHPDGVASLLTRIHDGSVLPPGTSTTAIVLRDDETSTDAFDRLKRTPPQSQI